ncbi:MAG: NUDIX domain-containing protein [bacterium]|nr:NUDIX domain-containing protein [bacterium]
MSKKRGAIGVIYQESRFLVIERSQHVRAPGMLCFPGGSIERGETDKQAVVRELREEIGVDAVPMERLWRNAAGKTVDLIWWQCEIPTDASFQLDAREVASFCWMTADEIVATKRILTSNRDFINAWRRGEFSLV